MAARRFEPQGFELHGPDLQRGVVMRVIAEWSAAPDPVMVRAMLTERGASETMMLQSPLGRLDPRQLSLTSVVPLRRDSSGRYEQVGAFFPSLSIMPLLGSPAYGLAAVGTF